MKLFITILALCFSSFTLAEDSQTKSNANILDPTEDPHLNLTFGISPFVGVLGLEFQKGHHAVGIGAPAVISYRYYAKPYQNTKFWGVSLGKIDIEDNNERVKAVFFRDFEATFIGAGGGYRWQWPSGWNVSASLALQYYDGEHSNPSSSSKAKETGILIYPGINGGFKF